MPVIINFRDVSCISLYSKQYVVYIINDFFSVCRYCSEKTGLMSADQLCAFLHKEQGLTDYDHSQATKLMNEFEISNLKDQGYMTQDGMDHFLIS